MNCEVGHEIEDWGGMWIDVGCGWGIGGGILGDWEWVVDIYTREQGVIDTIGYAYECRFYDVPSSLKSFKKFCDIQWANDGLIVDTTNALDIFEKIIVLWFIHNPNLTADQQENALNYVAKYSDGIPDVKFNYEGVSFNPLGLAIQMSGVDKLNLAIQLMKNGHDLKNSFYQKHDYIQILKGIKVFINCAPQKNLLNLPFFEQECLKQGVDFKNI